MSQLKPGYERILQHIKYLTNQSWLVDSQKFWPKYLFHFTDIKNAKSILTEGALFSRQRLIEMRKLDIDIASPEIIKTTPEKWKNHVRLYFRPRTPTQYRNEGIRPKNKLEYGGAHCPIPIVFIFDAKKILTLQSTSFSNGNLAARGVDVDNTVDFYLSLPFKKIYHDTVFSRLSDSDKKSIIFHRHAEVIVPEALDLSSLKYIICRSQGELETLIQLLPEQKRLNWINKIRPDTRSLFFFCEWVFIKKVSLSSSSINLRFNPSSHESESSPFNARLEIIEIKTNKKYIWEQKDFRARETLEFDLTNLEYPAHYEVSFFLDDNLAYRNTYIEQPEILF